jgi:integrase
MSANKRTYQKAKDHLGNESHDFYVDSLSGIYYFIKSIDGRMIKFSTKSKNLTTAKRIASKELKRRLGSQKATHQPLLGHWMRKYLKEKIDDGKIGESAKKNATNAIKQSFNFWKDLRPEEVNKDRWAEFYKWYKETYGFQFENAHKYFRNFLNWLSEEKHFGQPVLLRVPKIQNPESRETRKMRKEKKDHVFSDRDFKKIYDVASERERALILLMFTMGFRVESDALSAKWKQFRFDLSPPIYVFNEFENKAGLEGRQAIHTLTLEHLIRWKEKTGHSEWVFPQQNDPRKHLRSQMIGWDDLRARAKIGWHWTAHTFRHTCLTRLAEKGHPMHLICKCFRISAQEFMHTYAHLTPEGLGQMQDAIEVSF